MALFNYTSREINAKIVYYGPGLSGKTTNIKTIYEKIVPEKKGKLITLPTYSDRTLFFDFFPLEAGEIKGYKMRFHLYTVPGQVFYNATRKLVLKGADGVVFVADSQDGMMDSNLESLYNLKKNLADHGININDFPVVLQYNKRDLPNVLPVEVLDKTLNSRGLPYFSASASTGEGVLETLTAISKLVLGDLREMIESGRPKKRMPVPKETADTEAAITPSSVQGDIRHDRTEDLRNWVESDASAAVPRPAVEGQRGAESHVTMESIELGKALPEVTRITDTMMEGILDVALNIKLRVVTTKDGDKIRIKEVEVSDYEPKEIGVKGGE